MGICASCLGLARRESSSDPSDASHLLGDPFPPNQYGGVNADHRNSAQVDPEEIRRQRDALERLCAQTSDKLIDVAQSANTDEAGSKMASDYSRLFHERFRTINQDFADSRPSSASTATDEDETTWLRHIIEGDGPDVLKWKIPENLGPLSVQFDDVWAVATDKGTGKSVDWGGGRPA